MYYQLKFSYSLTRIVKDFKILYYQFYSVILNYVSKSFGNPKESQFYSIGSSVWQVLFSIVDKFTLNFVLIVTVQFYFICIEYSNETLKKFSLDHLDPGEIVSFVSFSIMFEIDYFNEKISFVDRKYFLKVIKFKAFIGHQYYYFICMYYNNNYSNYTL